MTRRIQQLRGILEFDRHTWHAKWGDEYIVYELSIRLDALPVGAKLSLQTVEEAKERNLTGVRKTRIMEVRKGATTYRETIFLREWGSFTIKIYLPKDIYGHPSHQCEYRINRKERRPVRVSQQMISFLVPEDEGLGQVPEPLRRSQQSREEPIPDDSLFAVREEH